MENIHQNMTGITDDKLEPELFQKNMEDSTTDHVLTFFQEFLDIMWHKNRTMPSFWISYIDLFYLTLSGQLEKQIGTSILRP